MSCEHERRTGAISRQGDPLRLTAATRATHRSRILQAAENILSLARCCLLFAGIRCEGQTSYRPESCRIGRRAKRVVRDDRMYTAHTITRPTRFIGVSVFIFAAFAVVHVGRLMLFAQSPTVRTIALTFDDLPYVAVESAEYVHDADRVTTEILHVLRVHSAPAVAFVNEARLQVEGETDARVAVLKRWADSGVILGNHTYSHADLNSLTVDQYEDDIIRGEVVKRRLREPRNHYPLYFRCPVTH